MCRFCDSTTHRLANGYSLPACGHSHPNFRKRPRVEEQRTNLEEQRAEQDEDDEETIGSEDSERSEESTTESEQADEEADFIDTLRSPHDFVREWCAVHVDVMASAKISKAGDGPRDLTRAATASKIDKHLKDLGELFEVLHTLQDNPNPTHGEEYYGLFDSIQFELDIHRRKAQQSKLSRF